MLFIIKVICFIDYILFLSDYIYIYINVLYKVIKVGICLVDVFDYLFIFCIVVIKLVILNDVKYFCDFFYFDSDLFLSNVWRLLIFVV